MSPRVLVVDDEPALLQMVAEAFQQEGYQVDAATSADRAFELFKAEEPDLVLLDVMMPGESGLDFCRRLRADSTVPIILLTGLRNEADIVTGLRAGADDYVTKPFSPRELLARVEATLRRRALDSGARQNEPISLDQGRFVLDLARRAVSVDQKEVPLTRREFAILAYLAGRAGQVVDHGELIEHVWGSNAARRIVDLRTYVKLLRRKIEPDPTRPRYLVARVGAGYVVPNSYPPGNQASPDAEADD
jgi:DNA-binding response OmpR family regulator